MVYDVRNHWAFNFSSALRFCLSLFLRRFPSVYACVCIVALTILRPSGESERALVCLGLRERDLIFSGTVLGAGEDDDELDDDEDDDELDDSADKLTNPTTTVAGFCVALCSPLALGVDIAPHVPLGLTPITNVVYKLYTACTHPLSQNGYE